MPKENKIPFCQRQIIDFHEFIYSIVDFDLFILSFMTETINRFFSIRGYGIIYFSTRKSKRRENVDACSAKRQHFCIKIRQISFKWAEIYYKHYF